MLDLVDRQLQEALAHRAERGGVAGGEEAVGALAPRLVLDPLARERLGRLARRLLGREDEGHVAAEHALEDRPDQRVVRAAEDHRVHAVALERRGVLAHGVCRLGPERIVALDQRHEPRAGDRGQGHARVERADERLVAAALDRRLRGEETDPAVARRLHGRVRLRCEHADHRHARARSAARAAPPR